MAGYPNPKTSKGGIAKRPHKGHPISSDTVLELIRKYRGNISYVADALGSARSSIRDKINREPILKQALEDSRERLLDQLEDTVWDRAVESNDTSLQTFILKTQGRKRGWEPNEQMNNAKDIATAAFEYITNRTKNPVERKK